MEYMGSRPVTGIDIVPPIAPGITSETRPEMGPEARPRIGPIRVCSMSDQTETAELEERSPEDAYKTVVRIVAGGIGEAIDRLMKVSQQLDALDHEPDSGPMLVKADPNVMAFVGWVSELPALASGAAESAQRMAYPFTRTLGVAIDTTAYLAEVTGVAPFIAGVTEPTRKAISEERERLTNVGTAEYARGRVLAVYAFQESTEGIVSLLSDSPELAELVRDQTIGITGSAVQEVRETGAAADGLTEGMFRRLLRRPDRPLPPKVGEET